MTIHQRKFNPVDLLDIISRVKEEDLKHSKWVVGEAVQKQIIRFYSKDVQNNATELRSIKGLPVRRSENPYDFYLQVGEDGKSSLPEGVFNG